MSRGPELVESIPEALNPAALAGSNTLVIAAPGMLDEYVAGGRFAVHGRVEHTFAEGLTDIPAAGVTRTFAEALAAPADVLVVLDGLYQAIQRTHSGSGTDFEDMESALETLLSRPGGVVFCVRPRALSWLLDSQSHTFSRAHLTRLDTVYCLRYRRYEDLPAATTAAEHSAGERLSDPDALSTMTCEGFEVRADGVSITTPATLAPGWAGDLSMGPNSRWLTARDVTLAMEAAGSDGGGLGGGIDMFLQPLTDAISSVADAGPAAFDRFDSDDPGRSALTLAACLIKSGTDLEAVTGPLGRLEVTPAAHRQIEAAWALPPDTLDRLASLTAGQLKALEQTLNDPPSKAAAAVERIGGTTKEISAVLDGVATTLASLDDHARSLRELRRLETAVANLDRLSRDIRVDRRRLLGFDRADTRADLSIVDIDAGNLAGPRSERIVDAVEEGGMVVLEGPRGTGKTTAAAAACSRLEETGVETVVPLFGSAEVTDIEAAIERSEASVLVTAFGGDTEYAFADIDTIWRLLAWLDRGLCEAVIVESRPSRFAVLADAVSADLAGGIDHTPWQERSRIDFDYSDAAGDSRMDTVVSQALRTLGTTATARERREITSLAAGRPDVALLAAGYATDPTRKLDNFETAPALARDAAKPLLDRGGDRSDAVDLFTLLCAVRIAETQELASLLGAHSLRVAGQHCSDSLGGAVVDALRTGADLSDVTWTVRPALLVETVFRYYHLQYGSHQETPADATRFAAVVDALDDSAVGISYLGLAWALVSEYGFARRRNDPGYQRHVRRAIDLLLGDLTGHLSRFLVVEVVVLSEVPVDPEQLGADAETLVSGSVRRAEKRDGTIPEWAAAERLLGAVIATGIDGPGDTLVGLAGAVASRFERTGACEAAGFLAGVYASAFRRLASSSPDPEAVRRRVQSVVRSVLSSAEAPAHDLESREFTAVAFGESLASVVEVRQPMGSEWPDVVVDAATEFLEGAPLRTFGGTALAARQDAPDTQWIEWLVDRYVAYAVSAVDRDEEGADVSASRVTEDQAAAVDVLTGVVTDATVVVEADEEGFQAVCGAVGALAGYDPDLFATVVSGVVDNLESGDITHGVQRSGDAPAETVGPFLLQVYADGIENAAHRGHSADTLTNLLGNGVESVRQSDAAADERSLLARTLARLFGSETDVDAVENAVLDGLDDPAEALYEQGLELLSSGSFQQAAGAFGTIWDRRPPETHSGRRRADAAGVLYAGALAVADGAEAGDDIVSEVVDTVAPESSELSVPVTGVFEALALGSERPTSGPDTELAPPGERGETTSTEGLEHEACKILVDALEAEWGPGMGASLAEVAGRGATDTDENEEDTATQGTDATRPSVLGPDPSRALDTGETGKRDEYREALAAWRSGGGRTAFETAGRGCRAVWATHESMAVNSEDHRLAVRAGAVWAAHLTVLAIDNEAAASELASVTGTVAVYREQLSPATSALLEWVRSGERAPLSTHDRSGETDLESLERTAIQRFLAAVEGLDTVHPEIDVEEYRSDEGVGDGPGSVDGTGDGSDILTEYATGLKLIAEGEFVNAVDPLLAAWDARAEAQPDQEPYALAAGVAVAVLVRDDPVLSLADSRVVSTVGPRAEELPPAAQPVFEALRDRSSGSSPSEIRDRAEPLPGGIEAPVGEAFTTLLSSL